MARELILETTFVVDLECELARGVEGPAQRFLLENGTARVYVAFITVGEIAVGFAPNDRHKLRRLIAPYKVIGYSEEVSWHYAQVYRYLRDQGLLIGTNDTWIAAVALASELGLVTRNERHFRRVPHLEVVPY